ncbi:MAG: Glucose-1-phosphate thymidylyltransferase [Candidatus Shapirobacteria bacterium GW2011_GWE1_38_10]|uniref:glucose-1-phosphate thymidylyltransferase n=1 Tax=Candidatus Shapirobacteria bacterium GW2011_GWE1_38_10 TaxID=1618488 RepID=A0A0G0KKL9_9BACT|nr:MAG: Glucose-1-phosphate thymidylyltransferase [Candidatus Shapirobacteria bacterium GW2011_GWF2_37_20]KKQ49724.1 MAG: Glucose-1-phosphate thymidylyltransferase [Candidatus Shapirobacteria bacterium GW2011_GWE1_38_10]KKQ64433.1 MAG: Glucose-1-phosphate thymidylyltransferase [Candidatus Shapirobacteria bacterium GW2011_GWF1_38_23]HBP51652.1 spore coat protein [Candidatus Shapirobacteria bacterium]
MKGIILAGGRATRLRPLTSVTSKQLLPVYDKPMIYYPLQTLIDAGIKDILIIIAPDYSGQFLNLLGDGSEFGVHFSYIVQKEPRGLADAFVIGEHFIDGDNVTMILGDNIFINQNFSESIKSFKSGGMIFAKEVPDPERYGVVEFGPKQEVLSIEEKPVNPKSNYAIVGLYTFDSRVCQAAKDLVPSARGEIEITDLHKFYLNKGELKVNTFTGTWEDAGTFESLLRVSNEVAHFQKIADKKL